MTDCTPYSGVKHEPARPAHLVYVKDVYGRRARINADHLIQPRGVLLPMYNQYGGRIESHRGKIGYIHIENIPPNELERARGKLK